MGKRHSKATVGTDVKITPTSPPTLKVDRIAKLAKDALVDIRRCDNLISVCAGALSEQGCDNDYAAADVLGNCAWPALNAAEKAIQEILSHIEPAEVANA